MANLNFLMVKTTFLAVKIPNDGSTCSTSPVLPGPRRWPCALGAFRARGAAHGAHGAGHHGAHHGAHHAVTWTWEKGGKHINFGRLTSLNWVRLGIFGNRRPMILRGYHGDTMGYVNWGFQSMGVSKTHFMAILMEKT